MRQRHTYALLLVPWLVAAASPARALEEPTPLRSFRSFDRTSYPDAPIGTVLQFVEDKRGLLWVIADRDLVTFDGHRFERISGAPMAPLPGQAKAMARRARGGLYVVHGPGLVSLWDGSRWQNLALRSPLGKVDEDAKGDLWGLTTDGKLVRLGTHGERWEAVGGLPNLNGFAPARGEGAWAWSDRILYRVRGDHAEQVGAGRPLPAGINAASVDTMSNLWLGLLDGSIVEATERGDWSLVPTAGCHLNRARDMATDDQGRLWIADRAGGVCFGSKRDGWTSWGPANGLRSSGVLAVFFDSSGSLWLGYNSNGIQQWVAPEWSHRVRWNETDAYPSRVSVADIASTADGGFLAAVLQKGLWRWDGAHMRAYGREQGLTEPANAVTELSPDTISVGSPLGLWESTAGRPFQRVFELPLGWVTRFFRSPTGVHYAGTTDNGLLVRRQGRWEAALALNSKLLDPYARAMLWRRNGELWVASLTGVTIFAGDRVRYLRAGAKDMPTTASELLEVSPSEVWIFGSGGVAVVNQESSRLLTESDGLPGRRMSSMALAPDGAIWVFGDGGAARFLGGKVTRRWDSTSGLLDALPLLGSAWVGRRGHIYFGTMGGLSQFQPLARPRRVRPLELYWITGPGTPGTPPSVVDRRGHWRWCAPSLVPGEVEFRVRVPGLYDAWNQPQRDPVLMLPNLSTGRWQIEVAARRRGATAWSKPLRTGFVVPPRWWETLWARLGLAALGLLTLTAVVHLRTRRLTARAAELDRQVTLRTAELTDAHARLSRANEKLSLLARIDGLTGLLNRAAFDEALEREWARAARAGEQLAVILGDVDYFKRYNDHYGHPAGDRCLRSVAAAIQQCAKRPSDVAARYGGEEFVLILPATSADGALQVAETILARLRREALPHEISAAASHVTMSLGVAAGSAADFATASALVRAADEELYQAKSQGRNQASVRRLPGDTVAAHRANDAQAPSSAALATYPQVDSTRQPVEIAAA